MNWPDDPKGDPGEDTVEQAAAARRGLGRWGLGMFVAFWLALLGVLAILFDVWLAGQHNPNQTPNAQYHADGSLEVVLQGNRQGHYVATGQIDGQAVSFMIDTGASDVVVPEAVAQRLGLSYGARRIYHTANGQIVGYTTVLRRVSLGPIQLQQVRGSINPAMGRGDDVLLGMSFLRRVEMRQRGGRLTLRYVPTKQ